MTTIAPEGMIPVAEFGKQKGIAADRVTEMIRDGFYVGRKVGDDWYIDGSELNDAKKKRTSGSRGRVNEQSASDRQEVVVTDIEMPFGSMVEFMIKWAIASIPALIVLYVLGAIAFGLLNGVLAGI